jgi:hypothetical protein
MKEEQDRVDAFLKNAIKMANVVAITHDDDEILWADVVESVRLEVSDAIRKRDFGYAASLIEELEVAIIVARKD